MSDFAEPTPPEPTGPFHANYWPWHGLLMHGEAPVMGVLDGQGSVVGIAWLAGSIPSRRGPAQLWRLEVGKHELEGRWLCWIREFIRLGDAAEDVWRHPTENRERKIGRPDDLRSSALPPSLARGP